MRRTTLSPKVIYQYAHEFSKMKKLPRGRGRPRAYSEAFVISIAAMQNLYNLSFREALEFVEIDFKGIPCLSTFHYRVTALEAEHLEQFLAFLGAHI
jgi:hypothetical protein